MAPACPRARARSARRFLGELVPFGPFAGPGEFVRAVRARPRGFPHAARRSCDHPRLAIGTRAGARPVPPDGREDLSVGADRHLEGDGPAVPAAEPVRLSRPSALGRSRERAASSSGSRSASWSMRTGENRWLTRRLTWPPFLLPAPGLPPSAMRDVDPTLGPEDSYGAVPSARPGPCAQGTSRPTPPPVDRPLPRRPGSMTETTPLRRRIDNPRPNAATGSPGTNEVPGEEPTDPRTTTGDWSS